LQFRDDASENEGKRKNKKNETNVRDGGRSTIARIDNYESKRDRSTSEIFVFKCENAQRKYIDLTCALHAGSDVNARVVPGSVPFLSDIK